MTACTLSRIFPGTPAEFAGIVAGGMTADSRMVAAGDAFVAMKGLTRDAREFIPEVSSKGVAAIFAEAGEKWSEARLENGVPVIPIANLAEEAGVMASRFYGEPSQALTVLAVTGTNGKTSVANLLAGALAQTGKLSAVLGTIGNGFYGKLDRASHTTPDAIRLQQYFADFLAGGASHVAMEASSHGLEQGRLNGTHVHTAIFTNLSRDHLDYHGDMDSYARAKARLFSWPGLKAAVLNADDERFREYVGVLAADVRLWSYSTNPATAADIVATHVEPSLSGLRVSLRTPQGNAVLESALLGHFNVSNLLAVLGGLLSVGLSLPDALQALTTARPVPGRMECFREQDLVVVVDYAHTPDALEKVLSSLREHTKGKLHCVFGCGGDRDKGKRPQMAAIAEKLADRLVITTDNPRSEKPEAIMSDMLAGLANPAAAVQEKDRRAAIRQAIATAAAGDIVVVAGKGHEDYQEIHGVRYPFSDVVEVKAALAARSPS